MMDKCTSTLKTTLLLFVFLGLQVAYADEIPIRLEKPAINTHDNQSIMRGARAYASYCLTCHSLEYMTYDPIAKAAGITQDKMPDKNKNWWFGTAPPDLSLIAIVRGQAWLYTYLHVFYKDKARPTGSNNLLIDNVNMPNPFGGFQGDQVLIVDKKQLFQETGLFTRKLPYYSVLQLERQGSLSSDEFDQMTQDLVNFLVYASEPKKYARERMGIWVLIYIALLAILVYLLKRAWWRNMR